MMKESKEYRLNCAFWAGKLAKDRNMLYSPNGILNRQNGKAHTDKLYPIGYERGYNYAGEEPGNPYREGIFK